MGMLAFDRARLDALRLAIGAALDDLYAVRSDDDAAADVMRSIRTACRTLGDLYLPRVQGVLDSHAMTSYRRAEIGDNGAAEVLAHATAHDRSWEVAADQLPGPPQPPGPGCLTFDEVLAEVRSGQLVPMLAPIDALGRAGSLYTSLAFAPGLRRPVGEINTTSNVLKVIDVASDGLPIGWHEHKSLSIVYLSDARVTSSVHVLSAYDRDDGPETMLDRTTEATVSGYMIIANDSGRADINVPIGPGMQDVTQSFPIISDSTSSYTGMFFPDRPPDFQPITHEPRFVNPPEWTFTTSSAPMVDGWGTWKL